VVGGGGLVGVLKLRPDNRLTAATAQKARAEAEKTEAEADAEQLRNVRRAANSAIQYATESEQRARTDLLQVRREFADYRASMEARMLDITRRLGEAEATVGAQQLEIQRLQLLGPAAPGRAWNALGEFGG
jgi:hypothetical protein